MSGNVLNICNKKILLYLSFMSMMTMCGKLSGCYMYFPVTKLI